MYPPRIVTKALLTAEEAYLAAVEFIDSYFQRGGRRGDELALLLSYAQPWRWDPRPDNPVGTGDPAAWSDWEQALAAARSKLTAHIRTREHDASG
jgi:hypothetical protein